MPEELALALAVRSVATTNSAICQMLITRNWQIAHRYSFVASTDIGKGINGHVLTQKPNRTIRKEELRASDM